MDETLEASRATVASRDLAPGATLGKYRLAHMLGEGGMGVVWAAHDPDLERSVALKVLRYENPSPELRTRLLREARAMAKLKHPNVLTVYEVGTDNDRDFIAMELVEGASLDEWLATKPSRHDIWDAVLAAGRGLAAAHRAGLVHRDFKPHNVLRSRDGRVLVTDFGLARGSEDIAPIADPKLPRVDALDVTMQATPSVPNAVGALTQTGAVLGTPAYMAPEQFLGAVSGPRTDQFAYCVTVWQLFTGERPFRGDTLDELRKASSAIANVKGNLPGAIRAVLVRGLDPDPEKRWPDMNELLAALERAKTAPKRRAQLGIAVVALGLSGLLAIKIWRAPSDTPAPAAATACPQTPEAELDKAWSAQRRAALGKKFADSPGILMLSTDFDGYRVRWLDDYRSACAQPLSAKTIAKVGCLLGQRDQLVGLVDLAANAPAHQLDGVEISGVLPRIEACDGESPVAPPTLPDDDRKKTIPELRVRLIGTRFQSPEEALKVMPALIKEAEATKWDPIIAEAHQSFAIAADRTSKYPEARDEYRTAMDVARRAHLFQLEADASEGWLSGEYEMASDPKVDRWKDLVAEARFAVHNGGADPVFEARILHEEARYARSRGQLDDAVTKNDQARTIAVANRDTSAALRYTSDEIELLFTRAGAGDSDRAWSIVQEMESVVGKALNLDAKHRRDLWAPAAFAANVRGDLVAAHAYADRDQGPPTVPPNAVATTGKVVDADGKPVADATVVAWRGIIRGDASRVYQHQRFMGDIAKTDANGSFTVRAAPDSAIIAELGDRRSTPQKIAADATLKLEPTTSRAGKIESADPNLTGIVAIQFYELAPGLAWMDATYVSPSGEFRLGGLPKGAATFRLDDWLDPNQASRKRIAQKWPYGQRVDAIVHGGKEPISIFVFRGKPPIPKTRAELDKLVETSTDVVGHPALVIGIGDQTPEGMPSYDTAARHAVLIANEPGPATVCAADDTHLTCSVVELHAASGSRYATPAHPVEFRW